MRTLILSLLIITAVTTICVAQEYPTKGTYAIYIQGTLAGTCVFEMTEDKDFYTYHSKTNVDHEPYILNLECVTKVDKKNYRPVEFIYNGEKKGTEKVSGVVTIENDTLYTTMEVNGESFPTWTDLKSEFTNIFENFVVEHEIILARAFLQTKANYQTFYLLFPSDFLSEKAIVSYQSEIELRTAKGDMVCKKLMVSTENADPFFSFIDPENNTPVYMIFPGAATEIFFLDYFEDDIHPRFPPPKSE